MVQWIIVAGVIVALAGFTCGVCSPHAAAWLRNRRNGSSIAPVADDAAAGGAGRSGDSPALPLSSSPPLQQRLASPESEPNRLMYGCIPAWLLEQPPPPPQLPAQPRHALARLSDRLARRVRLMRIVARSGSNGSRGASIGIAHAPEGGEAGRSASRSEGALWPPPLPQRPHRAAARRAAEPEEHEPELASEEYELPP